MIVLVMGVAGVGKTTIGTLLARRLGWRFIDADDFHPRENVAKMGAGIPLEDADRWPWLAHLNKVLKQDGPAVLACSALKQRYRDRLFQGVPDFAVVYLHGDAALIHQRAETRTHEYMPASLLESQFAALEPPAGAIRVDVAATPEECVAAILPRLPLNPPRRSPGVG